MLEVNLSAIDVVIGVVSGDVVDIIGVVSGVVVDVIGVVSGVVVAVVVAGVVGVMTYYQKIAFF
jgi:hypothetical protein